MNLHQATVNDRPTYEWADEAKNNLELCLACCEAELVVFEENRGTLAPAPFFVERATVLLAKEKRWAELVSVAEAYLTALERYRQQASGESAKVWLSPKVEKVRERLEKAKGKP